jgi:hypothetical protein
MSKLVPDELPELAWDTFWSLERINATRAAYGLPDLAVHEFYQEAPAPREELATDQQREDILWLQRGMSNELRKAKYWTEEERLDPRMTYKEAEGAIKYLRNWWNHGVPARFHRPAQLLPRELQQQNNKFLPL